MEFFQSAIVRCAVDGGSNHWRNFMLSQATDKQIKDKDPKDVIDPPDLITGDFDSITQDTVEFFKTIPKINTPDQDATDFTKAFTVLQPVMEQRKLHDVIVFHDCSGRLDQTMANLNTLFKMQKENCNVYLLGGDSITWLLRPGKHTIQIPLDLVTNQRWCSLMPVGSSAHNVTTTGLKWNLCKCLKKNKSSSISNWTIPTFQIMHKWSLVAWLVHQTHIQQSLYRFKRTAV